MTGLPKNLAIAALTLATLATAAFAFSNSLMPAAESWSLSGSIASALAPVLQGFYDLLQGLAGLTGRSIPLTYGEFVRKLAHLSEYFLLGAECALIASLLAEGRALRHIWACLFVPLAVAVMDEFLQQFAGRTSSVSDVVVAFVGALVGLIPYNNSAKMEGANKWLGVYCLRVLAVSAGVVLPILFQWSGLRDTPRFFSGLTALLFHRPIMIT